MDTRDGGADIYANQLAVDVAVAAKASLLEAGNFVRTLEERQGLQVGSPDEIAYRQGWVDKAAFATRAAMFAKSAYGSYLAQILKE